MRDSDLAVVPPEASLTFALNLSEIQRPNITSTQEFPASDTITIAQGRDLLVGTDGNFSVGESANAFSSGASNSSLGEELEASFLFEIENDRSLNSNFLEGQGIASIVPIGGISSATLDEPNAGNPITDIGFIDDLDQFLNLPSFLGRI